jgi:quercetin dioxygenase-like cupin family protein
MREPDLEIRRVVTGFDANGRSVVTSDEAVAIYPIGEEEFHGTRVYATAGSGGAAEGMGELPVGEFFPTSGAVMNIGEFPPGFAFPHHHSDTVDFAVVLAGEIELELDDGKCARMGPGGVVVQRGTNHAWRNVSDGWTRMMFILVANG